MKRFMRHTQTWGLWSETPARDDSTCQCRSGIGSLSPITAARVPGSRIGGSDKRAGQQSAEEADRSCTGHRDVSRQQEERGVREDVPVPERSQGRSSPSPATFYCWAVQSATRFIHRWKRLNTLVLICGRYFHTLSLLEEKTFLRCIMGNGGSGVS